MSKKLLLARTPRSKKLLISFFFCFVLLMPNLIISAFSETSDIDRISDKAIAFVSNRFNASMGLCSEVVEGTPNSLNFSGSVYWIYSDNILAYALLRNHNLTIANILRQSLLKYAAKFQYHDSNGFPVDLKHEPILGDSFPPNFVPSNAVLKDLDKSSSFKVCTEIDNGSDFNTPTNYVDWLAWIGLSYLNSGNRDLAIQYYNNIMKFWHGNGFQDSRYNDLTYYETFKLGLVIYFRKALQIPKPDVENTMERIIEICQLEKGGICVNYNDKLEVWGNPNTETTSLIGLAGIVKIPESTGGLWYQNPLEVGIIVIAVTLVCFTFCYALKKILDRFLDGKRVHRQKDK